MLPTIRMHIDVTIRALYIVTTRLIAKFKTDASQTNVRFLELVSHHIHSIRSRGLVFAAGCIGAWRDTFYFERFYEVF